MKQIDFLVEIKSQMHRVVAFYSAVGTLVNYLVDAQVKPFINHIMLSPGGEKSILNVSFTEFQSQVCHAVPDSCSISFKFYHGFVATLFAHIRIAVRLGHLWIRAEHSGLLRSLPRRCVDVQRGEHHICPRRTPDGRIDASRVQQHEP